MKITFFANPPSFIPDIAKHFAKLHGAGSINVFIRGDQQKFADCLQTSDVIWFEWCNELMLYALANFHLNHAKVICRLHSYEAFTAMPQQVDWSKIDDLILVNDSVKEVLNMMGTWDLIRDRCNVHTIPNLIKTDEFDLVDISEKKDKIAYVGHINYKKDASLILPIMEKMAECAFPHVLHSAGECQDLRYKMMFDRYYENVKPENIVFEGHQENINNWLKDKLYVLNTSLFESFNYGVAEAMLTGSIPLVRNWLGSDYVYPNLKTWNTVVECVELVEEFEALNIEEMREVQKANRQFIIDNYEFDTVIPRIEELVTPKIRLY